MGYLEDLRKIVRNRPLILVGVAVAVAVAVLNNNSEILLQKQYIKSI